MNSAVANKFAKAPDDARPQRYYVDKRIGTCAVIDRQKLTGTETRCIPTHAAVSVWSGYKDDNGDWRVEERKVSEARALCAALNEGG